MSALHLKEISLSALHLLLSFDRVQHAPTLLNQDDERFSLSAQEYIDRYHIQVYVSDSIRSILDAREERPLETALKYFNSVLQVPCAVNLSLQSAIPVMTMLPPESTTQTRAHVL